MTGTVTLAGMIDDLGALSSDLDTVLKTSVISLMCTVFVIWTGIQTKRPAPTLVALIAASAIWWSVVHMTVLRDKTGEDLNRDRSAPAAVVVVEPRAGGAL